MALSASNNFTLNAREVIYHALRKAGVSDIGQTPEIEDINIAKTELNMMLKHWQVHGPHLWLKQEDTQALTQGTASYALGTDVLRVVSARTTRNSIDTPMQELTKEEYNNLPLKSSTGFPTSFYFDAQMSAGTLYVWPTASDNDYTVSFTKQKRIDDIDSLSNDVEIPQEFFMTVTTCLASRLAGFYGIANPELKGDALTLEHEARGFDREPYIQFIAGGF